MHRVLTPADYRSASWKNSGGRTTEIASYPTGVGVDGFVWRVSVADVERNGPFSAFPGVDRTLVLLQGAGMILTGVGDPLEVHVHYEPVKFAGDVALDCTLTDGPVRDFNLMVRRAQAHGELAVVRGSSEAVASARFQLCYAAVGVCECLIAGHVPITLHDGHALWVDSSDVPGSLLRVNPLSSDAVALGVAIDLVGEGH